MIYGIVDIGSNSIRLSIFKWQGQRAKLLANKKTTAGLANYIQGGSMAAKGIERIIRTLQSYQAILTNLEIDEYFVFATASLRNIHNQAQVLAEVSAATGIKIQVLSGELEAELGFMGATSAVDLDRGVVVDIGGGSTEIVLFQNNRLLEAHSLPIGSLNLYNLYVHKIVPKQAEKKAIGQIIQAELAKLPACTEGFDCMCGVGGTARATARLNNELNSLPAGNKVVNGSDVKALLEAFHNHKRQTVKAALRAVPDRIHTILPGMMILSAVADYYHCKTIYVSNFGVREGYLYHEVLKKPLHMDKPAGNDSLEGIEKEGLKHEQ